MTRWPEVQVRRLFRIVNGGTPTSDPSHWDGQIQWATPVDLGRRHGSVLATTDRTLTDGGLRSGSASVPAGSLIVSTRAPIGYVVETTSTMAFNQGCRGLAPRSPIHVRYYRYAMESISPQLQAAGQGSTFVELSTELLAQHCLPRPSLDQQRGIAGFLDTETARIDALIAKKRQLSALLNVLWKSSCAALTGVGMPGRDSRHVQLRRVAELQAGAAFPHAHQGDTGGTIPYVKVGDLARVDDDGFVAEVENRVSPEVAEALRSPILPAGTIVLPKIGAALLNNRRAVLTERSCLDQNVMGVVVTHGSPEFVRFCLESIDLGRLSAPGPVPLLNEDAARGVRIPWPSLEEQMQVASELRTRRLRHRKALHAIIRQIELLREHRQALITAAVTGEMEVPGVAA